MALSTTPQRSRMMSGIRGKNTWPERALRTALFASGFRYRLNVRALPGAPDLVFAKYRAAVFVHGCFWHRHEECKYTTTPKSNAIFWREKFEGNVSRDAKNIQLLQQQGWRVAVVWECALKRSAIESARAVATWLPSSEPNLTVS